jgi:NADH dehydrogenase FAD-containing subunit
MGLGTVAPHKVVIVGGNFAGVSLAHYLLHNTLPALYKQHIARHPYFTYHVTLLTPNTHFFFKIASPRAVVNPTQASDDKIFKPLAEAFAEYDADKFEYIQGKAVRIIIERKEVHALVGGIHKSIKYNSLVIATGTTSDSPLWTIHDNHETSRTAIKRLHDDLEDKFGSDNSDKPACWVCIAGGGPVGVEVAGEIQSKYPRALVSLVTSSKCLLPNLPPEIGKKATKKLQKLGVHITLDWPLEDPATLAKTRAQPCSEHGEDSAWWWSPYNIFVNATGPKTINSAWLLPRWLDAEGRVLCDDAYFRVKGDAGFEVYVTGDIVAGSNKRAQDIDAMTVTVASSIGVDVNGQMGGPMFKNSRIPFFHNHPLAQKEYKPPSKNNITISLGQKEGVGQRSGIRLPSIVVRGIKSADVHLDKVVAMVTGKKWK